MLGNRFCFLKGDASEEWQLGFQDPASPIMDGIITLHHEIMYFLIVIVILVSWMLFRIIQLFSKQTPSSATHNVDLEIVWTTVPSILLLLVAIPSFSLLYSLDELTSPEITIKVLGNQWYWTYEYSGFNQEILLDSYLVLNDDLVLGSLRLLEVDNRLVLPIETPIRLFITSTDVLHSWAIPSLGVKMDACPGRLNEISIWIDREGVYYGQCSEICGLNHAYMPIVIEGVSPRTFTGYASHQEELNSNQKRFIDLVKNKNENLSNVEDIFDVLYEQLPPYEKVAVVVVYTTLVGLVVKICWDVFHP